MKTEKQPKPIEIYGTKPHNAGQVYLGTVRNCKTLKEAVERYNHAPLYERSVATYACFAAPAEIVSIA